MNNYSESSEEETQKDFNKFRYNRDEQLAAAEEGIPGSGPRVAAVPTPGSSRDAENYHMGHPRRGVALLLNHERVTGLDVRKGTAKDCRDLKWALTDLGFEVIALHDLTYQEVKAWLKQVAGMDHSDADCLVVVVMTHGKPGIVYAQDQPYHVEELWQSFTPDKCASLAGKPKLFFIQACRGKKVDNGVPVLGNIGQDCTDGSATSYTIPVQADILVAYSTVEGYYSWRNSNDGSWFIQSLCKELRVNGRSRDLMTILTFVNRWVAVDYQSEHNKDRNMNGKKQVPTISSTLTRLVFFPSKNDQDPSIPRKMSLLCVPFRNCF